MSSASTGSPEGPEGEPAVERIGRRVGAFVLDHRRAVILAWLIVVATLSAGLAYATFAPDARVFFGRDNPENRLLTELEETYTRANAVVFVLSSDGETLFTPEALGALADMTEEAWSIPYVLRVDSLANFNQTKADGDDIAVSPLYTAEEVGTQADADRIREEALGEDELVNRMVSADGTVAGIGVVVVLPETGPSAIPGIAAAAREQARQWEERWPWLSVGITGGVMADVTFAEAGKRDQNELVPVMAGLIVVFLAIGLSSLWATLAIVAVILGAVGCSLGSAGWAGIAMNAATGASPMSIMVLTIASCVHLIFTWSKRCGEGESHRDALLHSVKINAAPITVTNLTTLIGFLCMNFSASPPLRDLGNIVAVGLVFGWGMTLTLLPCLLSYMRGGVRMRLLVLEPMFVKLGDFVVARRRALIALFAVVAVIGGFGVYRVTLDDDYIRYFDDSFAFRRDTDFAERHMTGLNAVQFSFDSGREGGVFDPEFLRRIDRFSAWLQTQDHVVHVDSLAQLIKRLNQTVEGGGEEAYRIGDTSPANAQNLLLYELGLPVGHDLNGLIDINRQKTRLTAAVRNASSRDIRILSAHAEQWLADNMPEMAVPASGMSVVFAHLSERNIRSMISGTIIALVLISMTLLPAFRSVRLGLISLVPNLLPAFLAFGLWGYLVGSVNLAASVVSAMTLGIVVDDTVHLIMKYQRARRTLGLSPEAAVRSTLSAVGLPVVITTVAISSGFAVMSTSGLQLSQHLGGLSLIIMVIALLADILLLLPLLLVTDRQRS